MTQLAFFEVGIISTFKQYDHNFNPFPFDDLHRVGTKQKSYKSMLQDLKFFFSKEIYYYGWWMTFFVRIYCYGWWVTTCGNVNLPFEECTWWSMMDLIQVFLDHPWKICWLMIDLMIHTNFLSSLENILVDNQFDNSHLFWSSPKTTLWWIWFIHVFIILEECMFKLYIFWSFFFILMIHTNYWIEYVLKPKNPKRRKPKR